MTAAGVFPFKAVMGRGKMSMGYVELATTDACPLFPPGATARGQVFHFSEIVQASRGAWKVEAECRAGAGCMAACWPG